MSSEPRRLGKYELQKRLGHGGMGEVWKALDIQLQRYVAIKLLHADWQQDPEFVSRFTREAQFIASLHHPNITQIHDFQVAYPPDTATTTAYMVMDYIEGQTLSDFIRSTSRKGAFPAAEEIVYIFTGISLAIDYAHKHGMVHRDIKPSNILLDQRPPLTNPLGKPILIDFGIARLQGAHTGTVVGTLLGTPHYISPEQAKGLHGDHSSDLYSLGIILYEIVTGITPFRGETTMSILIQHINNIPTSPALINPNIPPQLSEVILKSIAKKPEDRFPSAAALTIAIAEAMRVPIPKQLLSTASPEISNTPTSSRQFASSSSSPSLSLSPSISQWQSPTKTASISSSPAKQGNLITPNSSIPNALGFSPANTQSPIPSNPRESAFPRNLAAGIQAPTPQQPARRRRRVITLIAALVLLFLICSVSAWFLLSRPHSTTSTSGPLGQVHFMNSGHAIAGGYDELQIDLTNIPDPPQGMTYYAWIESASSEQFRPHWQLLLHNGVVHTNNLTFPGSNNLLQPGTILLITRESSSGSPNVPTPDLSARLYYAQLTPISKIAFPINQCPSNDAAHVCLQ